MIVYNYIHDPSVFRQCDVTDNACIDEDSHYNVDGSADTSGGLQINFHVYFYMSS